MAAHPLTVHSAAMARRRNWASPPSWSTANPAQALRSVRETPLSNEAFNRMLQAESQQMRTIIQVAKIKVD